MRSAIGLPRVRPWRTPDVTSARSRSIFMRPPRPWPSWRRARSRSMSSGRSSRPAGRPSTTAVRPGPCDSPAVVKRSAIPPLPYRRSAGARRGLLLDDSHARPGGEGLRKDVLRGRGRGAHAGPGRREGLALLRLVRGDGVAALAEALAVHLEKLEVVADAAVDRAEGLLVGRVADLQGHVAAIGARRVAVALAAGGEGRVGDVEHGGLAIRARAEEDDGGRRLVRQQREVGDALEDLRLGAGLAEAEVSGVPEPLRGGRRGAARGRAAGAARAARGRAAGDGATAGRAR